MGTCAKGNGLILYIESALHQWGCWADRMAAKAVGYPAMCPMFNQMPRGDGYGSHAPLGTGEYVSDTDQAVNRLEPDMRALCVEVYQRRGTSQAIADRMGMSKRTLHRRIDDLHFQVLGHLNDIAARI